MISNTPPPIPRDRRTLADQWRYETAPPVVVTFPMQTTPRILLHGPATRKKKEALGWSTSIAIHAVFIVLIAILLAPAHLGDAARQVIMLSLSSDEGDDLDGATLELLQEDSVVSPELPGTFVPLEAISNKDLKALANLGDGSGSSGEGEDAGGQRGSFFGVQADGQEFVYVLDVSGSMRGARYLRAAAELVKSVNELQPSQRFYVLLFNNATTQLFGESTILPRSVLATRENKSQLADWLNHIEPNGSTDPRRALYLALQMHPSAVYMLSDGEFTDKQNKSERNLFTDEGDTYSIVEAAQSNIAIHAIAFEDPSSCKNMQRLARMTSGQYRFVDKNIDTEDALIAKAMVAKVSGNLSEAELLLREVLATSSHKESTNRARLELTLLHTTSSHDALDSNDLHQIINALAVLVNDDPKAEVSQGLQDTLITAIERLTQVPTVERESSSDDPRILLFMKSHSQSYAASKFFERFESIALQESTQLETDGELLATCSALSRFATKYPFMTSEKLNAAVNQLSDKLFAQVATLQDTGGVEATTWYLQDIVNCSGGTDIAKIAKSKQKELLFRLLGDLRNAKTHRDFKTAKGIQAEIDAAFLDIDDYLSMKSEFLKNEFAARSHLRLAQKLERAASGKNASRAYVWILNHFPYTFAAQVSKDRIQELGFTLEDAARELDLTRDELVATD